MCARRRTSRTIPSSSALDPVVADCDDWIKDFASEVERMLGSMLGSVDSDTYNDPVVPEHLERLVDFVVAREEMKRAHVRQHRLGSATSRNGDVIPGYPDGAIPKVLKMLRGAARHFNAADRGTGDVTLPSDINQRYMIALDSILGIRQGRVRANGAVGRDRVGFVRDRFDLETSPNPFYVNSTTIKQDEEGEYVTTTHEGVEFVDGMGTAMTAMMVVTSARRAFDECLGHQLPDESHFERFSVSDRGRLADPADPASRLVSVRNENDDKELFFVNFENLRGADGDSRASRGDFYARESDRAFLRFCEVYFEMFLEALRESRRREEALARETFERVQGRYYDMQALREAAYDAATSRSRQKSSIANSSSALLRELQKKKNACASSYEEVDAVAEANQRDLLEEEAREARRASHAARLAERAAEAKREKQRLKKQAKKRREQEEKEEQEKIEEAKKQATREAARERRDARDAAARAAAEKEEKAKEAADTRRRRDDSARAAAEAKPSSSSSSWPLDRTEGLLGPTAVGQTAVGETSEPRRPSVPTRVFLSLLMRNHAVVERWRSSSNPGCVSCGARVPERHGNRCAIPFAACDAASPDDALRALQAPEDGRRRLSPFTENDALARTFAGLGRARRRRSDAICRVGAAGAGAGARAGAAPPASDAWTSAPSSDAWTSARVPLAAVAGDAWREKTQTRGRGEEGARVHHLLRHGSGRGPISRRRLRLVRVQSPDAPFVSATVEGHTARLQRAVLCLRHRDRLTVSPGKTTLV